MVHGLQVYSRFAKIFELSIWQFARIARGNSVASYCSKISVSRVFSVFLKLKIEVPRVRNFQTEISEKKTRKVEKLIRFLVLVSKESEKLLQLFVRVFLLSIMLN